MRREAGSIGLGHFRYGVPSAAREAALGLPNAQRHRVRRSPAAASTSTVFACAQATASAPASVLRGGARCQTQFDHSRALCATVERRRPLIPTSTALAYETNHHSTASTHERPDCDSYGTECNEGIATLVATPEDDHDGGEQQYGARDRARKDDLAPPSSWLRHEHEASGTLKARRHWRRAAAPIEDAESASFAERHLLQACSTCEPGRPGRGWCLCICERRSEIEHSPVAVTDLPIRAKTTYSCKYRSVRLTAVCGLSVCLLLWKKPPSDRRLSDSSPASRRHRGGPRRRPAASRRLCSRAGESSRSTPRSPIRSSQGQPRFLLKRVGLGLLYA
jgi:hypothetical protein